MVYLVGQTVIKFANGEVGLVRDTYTSKKGYLRLPYVKYSTLNIAHGSGARYEQIYVLSMLHGVTIQHQDLSTIYSCL